VTYLRISIPCSYYVPISYRFQDIARYWSKIATLPTILLGVYLALIFRMTALEFDQDLWCENYTPEDGVDCFMMDLK